MLLCRVRPLRGALPAALPIPRGREDPPRIPLVFAEPWRWRTGSVCANPHRELGCPAQAVHGLIPAVGLRGCDLCPSSFHLSCVSMKELRLSSVWRNSVIPGCELVATSQNSARTCVHSSAPTTTRMSTMAVSRREWCDG